MKFDTIHTLNDDTTIVAISTAPGVGGIAVIRLSGPDAFNIADKIWQGKSLSEAKPNTVRIGYVHDTLGQVLDQAVATVFRSPASYTGQNTVEFAVHGSLYVQTELVASLIKAGAVMASPGEFTRRAFLAGKLGLTEAEAVADIIASDSRASHRAAIKQLTGRFASRLDELRHELIDLISLLELELDFSEEDVEFANRSQLRERITELRSHISRLLDTFSTGNAIRHGVPVAIVGPTNAGKSSLLNALLQTDRAIVSDIHGTTRDTIEETLRLGDYTYRFIDTAGLRDTSDPIERMGIDRSMEAVRNAQIIISVIDLSDIEKGEEFVNRIVENMSPEQNFIKVGNKIDTTDLRLTDGFNISAQTQFGLDSLKRRLTEIMEQRESTEDIIITNRRHAESLQRALEATDRTLHNLDTGLSTDLIAEDARDILHALAELTGEITTDQVLGNIFSRFCIGK